MEQRGTLATGYLSSGLPGLFLGWFSGESLPGRVPCFSSRCWDGCGVCECVPAFLTQLINPPQSLEGAAGQACACVPGWGARGRGPLFLPGFDSRVSPQLSPQLCPVRSNRPIGSLLPLSRHSGCLQPPVRDFWDLTGDPPGPSGFGSFRITAETGRMSPKKAFVNGQALGGTLWRACGLKAPRQELNLAWSCRGVGVVPRLVEGFQS